jgi:lysophospholipase L1-like esterase
VKFLNRILACLVSLLMLALVTEGGLRLLGYGPRPTMNRFDAAYGWTKTPGADIRRRTDEFDVRLVTNSRGLRESESLGYAKPDGIRRVLVVGDSFTLGYTVPEGDTIPRLLGERLRAEGRRVEVLNGGTEGWSTDQEVLWLAGEGARYAPDVVVLQMYENDIFWNSQASYLHYPKPQLAADGSRVAGGVALLDPGQGSWLKRNTALGSIASTFFAPPQMPTLAGSRLPAEWGVRLDEGATGYAETAIALEVFRSVAQEIGAEPLVLVIPDKAQLDPIARATMARVMNDPRYDPDRPYAAMVAAAAAAGLPVVGGLPPLRRAAATGPLYFAGDWHTNAAGNRVLADALADALAAPSFLGAAAKPAGGWHGPAPASAVESDGTLWIVLGFVWLILGTLYYQRFPGEGVLASYGSVGLLVGTVVGLIASIDFLAACRSWSSFSRPSCAAANGTCCRFWRGCSRSAACWSLRLRRPGSHPSSTPSSEKRGRSRRALRLEAGMISNQSGGFFDGR